jgi:hypothetical protein
MALALAQLLDMAHSFGLLATVRINAQGNHFRWRLALSGESLAPCVDHSLPGSIPKRASAGDTRQASIRFFLREA